MANLLAIHSVGNSLRTFLDNSYSDDLQSAHPCTFSLISSGELLSDHPRVRVVAVEESGRRASLYELRPTCTVLHELSGDELVASIRRAVQPMPLVAAGDAPPRGASGAFVRLTPLRDGSGGGSEAP